MRLLTNPDYNFSLFIFCQVANYLILDINSIWEEEGCNMVSMSCSEHDEFTANSQFITHLMGRILGAQGLRATPVRYLERTSSSFIASIRYQNLIYLLDFI